MAQSNASKQIKNSIKAHDKNINAGLDMYNQLHSSLDEKVKTSHKLVDKLNQRAESLQRCIAESKRSFQNLDACIQAKEEPLQLCMWRMHEREKRPLREQVRDNVEIALEEQRSRLLDMQRRLGEAIRYTKRMILSLTEKLDEVKQDINQKAQALKVDEMCLRTTHSSWQVVQERSAFPRERVAPPSGESIISGRVGHSSMIASTNEEQRKQDASRLSKQAAICEDEAKELNAKNAQLILRCDSEAKDALRKCEMMMQERISEHKGMRNRLVAEIQQTKLRIEHTKRTSEQTKTEIRALEEPIGMTANCASWRKQRAMKEHILDPVAAKLTEHQGLLIKAHEELRTNNRSERAVLQELAEHRDRLKEDFRDKSASMEIDLSCLTHETTSTGFGTSRAARGDLDYGSLPGLPSAGRALTAR